MASSRSLGSLTLDLIANIGGFTQGMSKAAREAQKSLDSIESSIKGFSENVTKLLEFAGITVGIDALVDGIKEAIKSMDELGKSALKVGLPVEQFSALAGAASISNVNVDSLVSTLGKFTKSIAAATNGTSEQAQIFKALGISIKDQNGNLKSSTDLMLEFSTQFKELGVNSTTTAAGIALFGKNFQDMIPFLSQGADGIKKAQEEAIELGAALSGQAADAAAKFQDNLSEINLATQGFKNQLVQALLPTLNEWTTSIVELGKDHEKMQDIATGLAGALRGLELVANAVAAAFAVIQATVETLTVAVANGVQHFKEYAMLAELAATNPAAAFSAAKALYSANANGMKGDAQAAADSVTASWSKAVDKIEAAFDRMGHNLNDPLTAPIKNATAGVVSLSEEINNIAGKGAKGNAGLVAATKQIAALGAAAIKSGEDVGQVQSVVAAGVAKLQQVSGSQGKLQALQAALNPSAAQQAEKLASALEALGNAVAKVNESSDPTQKAYNIYADTVRNLDQLGAKAIKAGASVKYVQDLVAQGVSGAQSKLQHDLQAPVLAAQAYKDALDQQLVAQQAANDAAVAAVGIGSQQAQEQQQLNKVLQDGAQAVADFTKRHADAIAQGDPQYTKELADLKQYWADVLKITTDGQQQLHDAQSNWLNGVNKAWDDFVAQQNNVAQISGQLTTDFLNQGSDAFASFIDGTKSAKDALTDFIDSFEQEITQAVSKQLLKSLFSIGGDGSGGNAGGLGDIISQLFGGGFGGSGSFFGHANGGTAPSGSISRVNERGPELLTVGGKDFLMMGGQSGRVTPNESMGRGVPNQTNNFYLAAPTSMKTQTQIANKAAYEMRRASRLK
jgi:lambda family phage tail tape measure protein